MIQKREGVDHETASKSGKWHLGQWKLMDLKWSPQQQHKKEKRWGQGGKRMKGEEGYDQVNGWVDSANSTFKLIAGVSMLGALVAAMSSENAEFRARGAGRAAGAELWRASDARHNVLSSRKFWAFARNTVSKFRLTKCQRPAQRPAEYIHTIHR